MPTETATLSNTVSGTESGTDQFWEKHAYQITGGGPVGTYGGDYVLKSTTPISRSYGPVASSDRLGFGPQAFGQVGYRGILGDASMSAPADTPYVANHTFIDPAAGNEPAALQEPGQATNQQNEDGIVGFSALVTNHFGLYQTLIAGLVKQGINRPESDYWSAKSLADWQALARLVDLPAIPRAAVVSGSQDGQRYVEKLLDLLAESGGTLGSGLAPKQITSSQLRGLERAIVTLYECTSVVAIFEMTSGDRLTFVAGHEEKLPAGERVMTGAISFGPAAAVITIKLV